MKSKLGLVAGLTFPEDATGSSFTYGLTHSFLISTEAANLTLHSEILLYSYSTELERRSVNSSYRVVTTKFEEKTNAIRFGTNLRIALSKGDGMQPFLGAGAAIDDGFRPNVSGGLQGRRLFFEMKLDVGQSQFFGLLGFKF